MYPFLSRIHKPGDLRGLERAELPLLAEEMRRRIIEVVAQNGGHLGSNLGTVELTIALVYLYDLEQDVIVWDVGHQAYPFKLLTGRHEQFHTLRRHRGLGAFLRRAESPYDAIDAGHGGTSISAASGMAMARALKREPGHVVAVIGDGSMTAGMALEGLNFAGHQKQPLTVVLNDNTWGISPNVGALSAYFGRIITGEHYNRLKGRIQGVLTSLLPSGLGQGLVDVVHKGQESIKGFFTPGALFEELGFKYVGPVDGHRLDHLLDTFANVRQYLDEPTIVHVVTRKGKGLAPAEEDVETWHSPPTFDPATATILKSTAPRKAPTYTEVFGDVVCELAAEDERVVAITAAMEKGTGLAKFHKLFPTRFFDVGMAEQHAVTFAAGLTCEGLVPIAAIYSTFLQRAFDQIIHDVALTGRPVVFCLDRGGLVGTDGATHHGAFDLSYLRCIPNLVVMAPKDENELRHMLKTAVLRRDGPTAIRYPRGNAEGVAFDPLMQAIPIGQGEVLRAGKDVALLAVGKMVAQAQRVADLLAKSGVEAAVLNARFVKPVDHGLIARFAREVGSLVTLEENVTMGGFGAAVAESLHAQGLHGTRLHMVGLPDRFVEGGEVAELWGEVGLDAPSIAKAIHDRVLGAQPRPVLQGS